MSTAPLDIEAVKKVIEHHKMLENCGGIVAAVSGGCDSSVLLHILWRLSREMGFKILCAHINHRIGRCGKSQVLAKYTVARLDTR